MWLIASFVAAIVVTAIWSYAPKEYKLDSLCLMLWGLTLMVMVDHVLGYKGGPFIEVETQGLIQNGAVLGVAMLAPLIAIWGIQLIISKQTRDFTTR
jgi:hypothetical protein